MHDINGLIVGSPVRLMGMKIGNISQIKYDYDQVLITMKITKKDFISLMEQLLR
jgi:ABC-type transporter Mla subunit MlaD